MLNSILMIVLTQYLATDGNPVTPFDPWKQSATYELTVRVDPKPLLAGGKQVRLWIPLPARTPHQRVVHERIESPWSYRVTTDEYGNRMIYVEPESKPGIRPMIELRIVVERAPGSTVRRTTFSKDDPGDPRRYLKESSMIPTTGVVRRVALQALGRAVTPVDRVRAFFDYVVRNLAYDKRVEGWGRGDAVRACRVHSGNCTDFHSLFIGMARSQHIPARFIIGFPLDSSLSEGDVAGYHCWAEVYLAGLGWAPLDASEARKTGRGRAYLGKVPSDRVAFTIGRDLTLNPPQAGEPLNFFVYPYAEIDGRAFDSVPWTLHFHRANTTAPRSSK